MPKFTGLRPKNRLKKLNKMKLTSEQEFIKSLSPEQIKLLDHIDYAHAVDRDYRKIREYGRELNVMWCKRSTLETETSLGSICATLIEIVNELQNK